MRVVAVLDRRLNREWAEAELMSDLVARAEAYVATRRYAGNAVGCAFITDLIAELKAARASEERHLHEIFHLQDDLKAARAEVKLPTERDGARVAPEHLGQLWDCVEDTRQSHRTSPPTERAH